MPSLFLILVLAYSVWEGYQYLMDRDNATAWERRARWLAVRVNAVHWLEKVTPMALAVWIGAAAILLLFRYLQWPISLFWILVGAAFLSVFVVGVRAARTRFWRREDALAYLEDQAGLHSRLSAAMESGGAWPEPVRVSGKLRWHGFRTCGVWLLGMLLLVGSMSVPVRPADSSPAGAREKPSALRQAEAWLETIREENLADPEALQRLEEALASLTDQSPEAWYDHGNLEAAHRLRSSLEDALHDMLRDFSNLDSALADAQQSGGLSPEQASRLSRAANEISERMESGPLGMESRFAEALRNVGEMSAESPSNGEQLQEMRQCMQQGIAGAQACLGDGWGDEWTLAEWDEGSQPGAGGIGQGDADAAPLIVGPATDRLESPEEALDPAHEETTTLGDLVGRDWIEPEAADTFQAGAAGDLSVTAEQRAAPVSRSHFLPSERRILREYFDYD